MVRLRVLVEHRRLEQGRALCDRRQDWRAGADRTLPDRKGANWVEIVALD
jgi:hypothetical protein